MKIFISHAAEDRDSAEILARTLDKITLGQIKVWYSSDINESGGINPGENWFNKIITKLEESDALIAIITPNSIIKPWLYYESGMAQSLKSCAVMPVCININREEVLPPLGLYQCYQFSDYSSLKEFISKLLKQFDIVFDEDLCKSVLERTINELIKIKPNFIKTSPKEKIDIQAILNDIKNHVDKRFIEFVGNEKKDNIQTKYTIPIEIYISKKEFNTQYIEITDSDNVQDILNKIYYLMDSSIKAFTYLQSWILVEKNSNLKMVMYEVTKMVPAKYVFTRNSHWQVYKLDTNYNPSSDISKCITY